MKKKNAADILLSTPVSEKAAVLHDMYTGMMDKIDGQIADTVKKFCNLPGIKDCYVRNLMVDDDFAEMLTCFMQSNHADDNLQIMDENGIIGLYDFETAGNNVDLVNYGFVNGMKAWFFITWNVSSFVADCKISDFCYDVLQEAKKSGSVDMTLNSKEDVNFIFATDMSIMNAYLKLIIQYQKFADALLPALKKVYKKYLNYVN